SGCSAAVTFCSMLVSTAGRVAVFMAAESMGRVERFNRARMLSLLYLSLIYLSLIYLSLLYNARFCDYGARHGNRLVSGPHAQGPEGYHTGFAAGRRGARARRRAPALFQRKPA